MANISDSPRSTCQLNALAEAGRADTVRLDGQQLFRLCGDDGHHHHLVCTNCGKTVETESPSESWLKGISDKYGFTIERHTLEVFGLREGLPEGGQVAAVCRISVGIVSPSAQSNRKNRKEKTLDVVSFQTRI